MAEPTWTASRGAFGEAARWFAASVPAAPGHWHEQALGEWTVRDLVGHTGRALSTVETYLDQGAGDVELESAVDYVRAAASMATYRDAVAERGREAGRQLGDDPVGAVQTLAERVLVRLDDATGNELVGTPMGGMRLVRYLPTRTFELTVHTCDLRTALQLSVDVVPEAAVAHSLQLVGALAVASGRTVPLLLAATGRTELPEGFTVL